MSSGYLMTGRGRSPLEPPFPQTQLHRNSSPISGGSPVRVCCPGRLHQLPGGAFGVGMEPVPPLGGVYPRAGVLRGCPGCAAPLSRAHSRSPALLSPNSPCAGKGCHGGERGVGGSRQEPAASGQWGRILLQGLLLQAILGTSAAQSSVRSLGRAHTSFLGGGWSFCVSKNAFSCSAGREEVKTSWTFGFSQSPCPSSVHFCLNQLKRLWTWHSVV